MVISYQNARKYIGQPVCVQVKGGKRHYGILRDVRRDGMMLAPVGPGFAGGQTEDGQFVTADQAGRADAETCFFPFFFIPFLVALALLPLAASPWYGRGYPGPGYGRRGYY
jgi:hypothetical protein